MADTTVLIPPEEKKKKTSPLQWAYMLSLFLSCVAVLFGLFGFFKKPSVSDAIVFPFSMKDIIGSIKVGDAVSINKDGKLQLGAGTTITTGIKEWEKAQFSHLHSTNVGEHLFVYAYDGNIAVDYIDDNGNVSYEVTSPLPVVGEKTRSVDEMFTLDNNVVIIIGSNEVLPCAIIEQKDTAEIMCYEGVRFTAHTSANALGDTLGDKCFALSYFHTSDENKVYHLATRTGCIERGEKITITMTEENLYSENYMFHAIAGLSEETYVLAKAMDMTMTNNDIQFQLATVKNGTIKVAKEIVLRNRTNFGFFDMDNLNDHQIVVTFIDGNLNNGLESVLLIYDPDLKRLSIGPFLDNQDGGASGMSDSGLYNFIHIRVMSETRFAVFYSSVINHGSTALCLGEVTPANDLIAVGPEYILSSPMVDPSTQYYWLGEAPLFNNRLVLIESLTSKDAEKAHAEMHLLDIKPLPLGVVAEYTSSTANVAVSGKISFNNQKFQPGYNYYADHLGNIIRGELVGSMNTDAYYIYVETEDGKILSDDNRLGFAIDENTLFLKVHNYHVC